MEPLIQTSPEAMALFEFRYLLIVGTSLAIICGVLLLIIRFTPLTLPLLLPILSNIFLFYLFIVHSLLPLAIFLVIILSYLLFCYRKSFIGLFEREPISNLFPLVIYMLDSLYQVVLQHFLMK